MKKKKNKKELDLKTTANELTMSLDQEVQTLFSVLKINNLSDPETRKERIETFGTNNRLTKKFNFVKEYLKSLFEPFNILLIIIGIVELLIWQFYNPENQTAVESILELVSALIIFLMVLLASIVDFIQEYMSFKNTNKLLKLITNDVYLINQKVSSIDEINDDLLINHVTKVHDIDLTKGDLVYLKTGDIIPADMKIIWSNDLYVDQSSLTGESDPVYKTNKFTKTKDIFSASNLLISDTKILRGKALGLVLTIGDETYANKIISISNETNDETDYEVGLNKVTKIILFLILAFFPIVFVISGLRTGNQWVSSLIFAISMVVSLIPESLPAILSSNIQVGSKQMARQKIVVKNLKCVQNLGSTTVIATDKTGTLTTGKLKVVNYLNKHYQVDDEFLRQTYLSVYFQNNLANQIDDSINSFWKTKIKKTDFKSCQLVASEEFNFETRISSVLVRENNKLIQITKGAPSEMISRMKIAKSDLEKLIPYITDLENESLKVIIVAKKIGVEKIEDNNLEFYGIIVFKNEIKPGIQKVMKVFESYHLDLKILTGDSENVSEKLGEELKLKNTQTINGESFSKLPQKARLKAVSQYGIFAKLNPIEKAEIVTNLQTNKEVVTYLGDGINDVLALKKADVGISVNNGSAAAKATSDVILLKKDLGILETGILEGRKIFTNAIKFIKIVVTMNFGLLVTILIGSIWFEFNAMSPIQLLLQNLIYDFMNLAFVFDNVDLDYIKKPKAWNPKSVLTFGLYNGVVPILISVTNFLIVGYAFNLFNEINTASSAELRIVYIQQFQTTFFLESLTTHIMMVIVYRTDQWSIIKSRPSLTLSLVLVGFLGLGFFLIYTPKVNTTLGFKAMEDNYWLIAYSSYFLLAYGLGEFSKWSYKKIFHKWI